MANSPRNRRLARTLGACCAGLLGLAAGAQSARDTGKIVMDAVPVEVNYRDNTAVFRDVVITQGDIRIEASEANVKGGLDFENGEWTISGNVRIRAEGGNLTADKAVVWFSNNAISRARITGSPAQFEQLRKDGTTSRGRAPTIDYETAAGTVAFRDDAWLLVGCNEMTARELVYNIKAQSVQNAGRVRFVIQPESKTGQPCNVPQAPASTPP
jgi:lipopolysaccharide transport protein LptA